MDKDGLKPGSSTIRVRPNRVFSIEERQKFEISVDGIYSVNLILQKDYNTDLVIPIQREKEISYTNDVGYKYMTFVVVKGNNETFNGQDLSNIKVTVRLYPQKAPDFQKLLSEKIEDAPVDGREYVRKDGKWFAISEEPSISDYENVKIELGSFGGRFNKISSPTRARTTDTWEIQTGDLIKAEINKGLRLNLCLAMPYDSSMTYPIQNVQSFEYENTTGNNEFALAIRKEDNSDISASDLEGVNLHITIIRQSVSGGLEKEPITPGLHKFSIEIDTTINDDTIVTDTSNGEPKLENDMGLLYIPASYSKEGKPTKLIIQCHGASTNYNVADSSNISHTLSTLTNTDYFLANGFAVMDVSGMPGIINNSATHMCNPVALRSYLKAYETIVRKYNIDPNGCFVIGWSMGSLTALQLSQSGIIPVKGCVIYNPAWEFSRMWMLVGNYFTQDRVLEIKNYVAGKFNFQGVRDFSYTDPCSDSEWKFIIDNIGRVAGYNILNNLVSNMDPKEIESLISEVYGESKPSYLPESFESLAQLLLAFKTAQRNSNKQNVLEAEKKLYQMCSLKFPVPLKIFHNNEDTIAPYRYSEYYYDVLKRGGSNVEFRKFKTGGHSGAGVTKSVTVNGNQYSINVLAEEIMQFINHYS